MGQDCRGVDSVDKVVFRDVSMENGVCIRAPWVQGRVFDPEQAGWGTDAQGTDSKEGGGV